MDEWECSKCGEKNYLTRKVCRSCSGPAPKWAMEQGDSSRSAKQAMVAAKESKEKLAKCPVPILPTGAGSKE